MQQNFTQPPALPPVRMRRVRVAGHDLDLPDVQWLRDLVSSTQTWAMATHNAAQINQVWRGPDLVAAPTITVSYPYHVVTGAGAIDTISAIATFSGGVVYLLNSGAWSLVTGGNIANAFVPPPGSLVELMYDAITKMWFIVEGGSLTMGAAIVNGHPNDVLFVGPLGELEQDDNFQWIAASGLHLKAALNMEAGADVALGSGSLVTQYNGIPTVLGGVPSILANADLPAQTAAIPPTTLYAVPASGQGRYRVSYTATVTTAASVSSVLGGTNGFQVVFTNADGSVVVTTPAGPTVSLNTTQAYLSGSLIVYAKASTNVQFSFDYTSAGTAMVFNLQVVLEVLG